MPALHASNVIHFAAIDTQPVSGVREDRRLAPRRRVLKGAHAAYNDRYCSIPCAVRDISATGARIRSEGSVNIPDTFDLIIDLDGLEAACEVVWRKGSDIGVRFIGAPRRTTPTRRQAIEMSEPDRSVLRRRPKPAAPR